MRKLYILVLITVLGAFGCDEDNAGPIGGTGGGMAGAGGDGGSGGTPLDLDIEPGEVRAGQLSAAQLPQDENGLAVYSEGDFALVNENIAVIIEGSGPSDLYAPFGGLIAGIARFDNGALVDRADFNEVGVGLRRFLVNAQTVTLLNDGTDGESAVVRAEGPFVALPFLEDVVGGTGAGGILLGAPPPDDATFQATTATVDYELAAGAEFLDVFYSVSQDLVAIKPVYLFIQSQRMPTYVPGNGFGVGDITQDFDYVAFIDENAMSYAVEDPRGPMRSTFASVSSFGFNSPEISGVMPLDGAVQDFNANTRVHLMRLHVGGNGLNGLRSAIARNMGNTQRTITGTVENADSSPAAGVRVHAETPAPDPTHLTRVLTGADGSYSLSVPAGQDVQLRAFSRGDGITDPLVVDAATDTADITMPAKGTIHVVATEGATPLPVRVQVIPDAAGFQPPGNFGEPRVPLSDRLHVVFPTDGDVTLTAPVGDHRVVVSRGYEYDIVDTDISVGEGMETMVTADLTRVVDTTGVMCGDFHIHTTRSPDSPDAQEFKVASAAGDGVELPVRTDHEFVAAFEPVVEAEGLGDWMYGLSSLELTTFSWGHFGVFPLEPDPTEINGGAVTWTTVDGDGAVEVMMPVEVFNDARSRSGEPEVIIFHPRDRPGSGGGFSAISGGAYFAGPAGGLGALVNVGGVDYDPITDTVRGNGKPGFDSTDPGTFDSTPWWDTDFRTVEVFNDSSFEENKRNAGRIFSMDPEDDFSEAIGTVDDWFGLLNSAERPDGVFAVGSSDSHSVMGGSPVGYPRTCIFVGTDDPQTLRADGNSPQMIKTLIQSGRAVINGGFFVTASSGATGPGQTLAGAGPYMIDVEVNAPLWVGDVELVDMWVSSAGVVTQTVLAEAPDVSIMNGSVTRYTGSAMVPAGADWVVFHARGAFEPSISSRSAQPQTLAPVHPGRLPFGVTNPIFFEAP